MKKTTWDRSFANYLTLINVAYVNAPSSPGNGKWLTTGPETLDIFCRDFY